MSRDCHYLLNIPLPQLNSKKSQISTFSTTTTTSRKTIPVLSKPAYRLLQRTGGGVQVVQDTLGWERLRKICANLISVSRQGFAGHRTEQLDGHSQEQQRHRQAPIDDDDHH